MTTISVPLTPTLIGHLDEIVANTGASRAAVMRRALEHLAEDEAIHAVLIAEQEMRDGKIIRGDLRKLLLED